MALIQMDLMASSLQQFVNVAAIVPVEKGPGAYPVLYLLSDLDGGPLDYVMHSPIAALSSDRGIAVMMVAPASREGYQDTPQKAENMETFIASELPRICSRSFPICKDAAHTFIAGVGAGGEAALHFQKAYPQVFGKAKCLPVLTPETAYDTMTELLNFLLQTEGGSSWQS